MLRYLLTSLLITFFLNASVCAQQAEKKKQGIAVGVDLSRYINKLLYPERTALEFSGRLAFRENTYAIGELGYENVDFSNAQYDYLSNGTYMRLGVDYDFFKVDEPNNNDNIIIGCRYGIAIQEHSSPEYRVISDYWGNSKGSVASYNLSSHWIELVFGMRSEVLKNIYLGWALRLKTKLYVANSDLLAPYVIPGFGNGDNAVNIGLSYSIEYQIPFNKKRKHFEIE